MTLFLILLALLALWALARLSSVVRSDGYGQRTPPPWHPEGLPTDRGMRA